MADEDLGAGFVTITLEDQRAIDSAEKLAEKLARVLDRGARIAGQRIERAINRAVRAVSPARIEVVADVSRLNQQLARAVSQLAHAEAQITVVPKVNVAQWRRDILAATAGIEIPIRVIPNVSGFDRRIREITTPTIRANVEPNVNTARLTSALKVLGTVASKAVGPLAGLLKFGAVGIAAASAAQSVAGFTAALAPAVGILAAGPAVVLGYASALGTLKLATAGVGDAFGAALSGDAKKFDEALKTLSPSARAVAKEVQALKPAFDDLRKSVQEALFSQLTGQLTATAKVLQGPLKEGLSGIAQEFGAAGKQLLQFVQGKDAVSDIGQILSGTQQALGGLGQSAQDVLQGLLSIGSSISDAFGTRLSGGIQAVAGKFGSFLFEAGESGKAVQWVDNALVVFSQLGQIVGNVGSILVGAFKSAQDVGGGLLNNLVAVTGQVKAFVQSAEGSAALANVFKAVSSIAANLGPIIGAVVTQIGAIAPALVPILNTLGPAIQNAVSAVGPAIAALAPAVLSIAQALAEAIGELKFSGVLEQLAGAIGGIAKAIAPVLPIAAQLVAALGSALLPIISALQPVIGIAVSVIGNLATAIQPLLAVAGKLVALLGPILTPILAAVGSIVNALMPLFSTLATILDTVLSPILAVLPQLLQPFLDRVSELVSALLPPLNELLVALEPSLSQLTQAVVQVATALAPVLAQFTQLGVELLNKFIPLLTPLIGLIGDLAAILAGRLAQILTGIVVPALNVVAALLHGDFSAAFDAAKDVIKGWATLIKDTFTEIPGKVLDAVSKFGSLLYDAGQDLIKGLINGIKSMAGNLGGAIKDVASSAVDSVKNFLGIHSPSTVMNRIGVQGGQGLVNGFRSMAAAVGAAARTMAQRASAAVTRVSASLDASALVLTPTVDTTSLDAAARKLAQRNLTVTLEPTVDTSRLGSITQPFGTAGAPSLSAPASGPMTGSTAPGANAVRNSRQAAAQAVSSGTGGPAVVNNFTINEVGDGEATAQRVLNRLVTADGTYLI